MAVTNNENQSIIRSTVKKIDILDKKIDSMYKDTYTSRPDNRKNMDMIVDNMDSVLDKLQGSESSVSRMSELLGRVSGDNKSNSGKLMNTVQDLFQDQTVMGSLFANDNVHRYIAGQNYNYDLICKYLPKLQDALEIKRDNVLCSDSFSKQFLNPKSVRTSKEEIEKFSNNCDKLEDEYDISEFLDDTYMKVSKYGEDFIYVVPYPVAFERLFQKTNRRMQGSRMGQVTLFEGYQSEQVCIKSGFQKSKEFKDYIVSIKESYNIDEASDILGKSELPEMGEVKLHFNSTNIIPSTVNEVAIIRDKQDATKLQSMMSIFESTNVKSNTVISEANKSGLVSMFDNVNKQNDKFKRKNTLSASSDGLIVSNLDRNPEDIDKDFLGAVLERLPRENVLPIYIGKKCLGYYYFEFAEDPGACGYCGGHHATMTPNIGNGLKYTYEMTENQQELAIRYISAKISQAIDTKFINANKDLKEEIYAILNYNEKFDISRSNNIGVTFIPAEDLVHCYFKMDEFTHRGISDLQRSVVPAMLYILLYLTDIIGKITRSTDKRIYYVKQNVETNVARTMMNVVGQIKKGNMGMRQIESLNNILNIVGKYNDFIIPVGQSGDSPIQFEVMQGQDIQSPTDIMEKMEEAAINTILPYEFVNATLQQDFAIRFSMSNSRFLKSIQTAQRKTEKFFSKIFTRVYNYEYGEKFDKIEIILPPPTYLAMNNNSQIIDNVTQMCDKIIESEMANEDEDIKSEFKKLYVRDNLGTYIDFDKIEKLRTLAKVNVEAAKDPETNSDVDDVMDDDL